MSKIFDCCMTLDGKSQIFKLSNIYLIKNNKKYKELITQKNLSKKSSIDLIYYI